MSGPSSAFPQLPQDVLDAITSSYLSITHVARLSLASKQEFHRAWAQPKYLDARFLEMDSTITTHGIESRVNLMRRVCLSMTGLAVLDFSSIAHEPRLRESTESLF
eukprot:TRINITY_DN5352_c0_g1_i1.p2 TRINITY_DN5352_c0_g1~~TRINITY_DN5352_c0_g1_i1.p2  ORF type:complete len:106 (+),score=5.96 TRINITY_DN5352_c0_g1_i1:645-962(+)